MKAREMLKLASMLAGVMGLWTAVAFAQAQRTEPGTNEQVFQLPALSVEAQRLDSLTVPSKAQARQELREVPGNTGLIETETVRKGRSGSLAEILQQSPSIYSVSRFGGSEDRLSIRGSGITQTWESRGVRLLRNGLPLTEADGLTRSQLVDPLIVQRAEVYPGANALEYGAATLGGAINLITPTGYTADTLTAHLEAGSDAWSRAQLASGQVLGDSGLDYFASVSGLHQNGFRKASDEEQSVQFYGNLGYRASTWAEHRLHFTYMKQDLELPGSLTKDQVKDDPEQANNLWRRSRGQRNFDPLLRLDWQSALTLSPDTRLDLGASWQHLEMFHVLPSFLFSPGAPQSQVLTLNSNDTSLNARLRSQGQWLGLTQKLTLGARAAHGETETDYFVSRFGTTSKGAKARTEDGRALTVEFFAEDRIAVSEALTLILGGQWAYAQRKVKTNQVDPAQPLGGGFTGDGDYAQLNPKIGLIYQITPAAQLFGNVSRSFEPPSLSELANTVTGKPLDSQDAWTVELGSRGHWGNLDWQLAGYYAWLDREILVTETPPGTGNFATANADQTIHTGLELGLAYHQPLNWLGADQLTTRVNYTLNEFSFDDDPAFGDNRLPGIPEHVIRVELSYRHPSGFYLTPSVDINAGKAFVDFANTLQNNPYAIVNLRTGFDHPAGWTVFLEAENLANERYASNTGVIADASSGSGNPAVFNPGRPLSVFGGFEVRF